MESVKWLLSIMKRYKWWLVLGFVMTTILAFFPLFKPYVSGRIVDDVLLGGKYNLLPVLVVSFLLLIILSDVMRYCTRVVFEILSQGILHDMRDMVYRKLLQEDFAFYNRKRTGDLMSRQTGDMDGIRHFLTQFIYTIYQNALYLILALVMVFTINVKLACALMVALPLIMLTAYLQSKKVKPVFQRNRECYSSLSTIVQENISGNRVVKAFAKEDYEIEKFSVENDKYRDAQIAGSKVWSGFSPIFILLSTMQDCILMAFGGYLVIQGEMSLGNLVTVSGYLWMITNFCLYIGGWINLTQDCLVSLDKIYQTYKEEPQVQTPRVGGIHRKILGNVEFRDVCYQADDEEILRDISFTVKAGQTVGIIGSTGSGKSTLMNLLCRFYDATSGEVLVDGVNVKQRDLYNLREHIGMAMQDVFLFSDTIEGNIAYAKPDCAFEEVKKAAIMADANHFIKELPEGYDTIVGERGVGLSGGQKQRISLARALLKDPTILILDDTTSAVDMETESYIQKQLKNIQHEKDCTIFVIAYRISSIKDADLILVMDRGRIIERGTHESLLQENGYYAATFRNQYGEVPYDLLSKHKNKEE